MQYYLVSVKFNVSYDYEHIIDAVAFNEFVFILYKYDKCCCNLTCYWMVDPVGFML